MIEWIKKPLLLNEIKTMMGNGPLTRDLEQFYAKNIVDLLVQNVKKNTAAFMLNCTFDDLLKVKKMLLKAEKLDDIDEQVKGFYA